MSESYWIRVSAQWNNCYDSRSPGFPTENTREFCILLTLDLAHLTRLILPTKFGHDLLVWCLAVGSFRFGTLNLALS